MHAGDPAGAEPHLGAAADHERAADDHLNLASNLQNLSECYRWLGDADRARHAAAESLNHTAPTAAWLSRARLAAALDLAGDTRAADTQFAATDLACLHTDPDGDHLFSVCGTWWGEFLLRTGRPAAARALTGRNQEISRRYGWNEDIARTDRPPATASHTLTRAPPVSGYPVPAVSRQ